MEVFSLDVLWGKNSKMASEGHFLQELLFEEYIVSWTGVWTCLLRKMLIKGDSIVKNVIEMLFAEII